MDTRKYEVGDRVSLRCGKPFSNGEYVATLDYHGRGKLTWYLKETDTWVHEDSLMLVGNADRPSRSDVELEKLGVKPVPVEAADIIVKPSHYAKWKIEPITFIMRNGFEFWRGNIVKYASRAGSKIYDGMDEVGSEITDLKKVIRYAEMRINQLQGETEL